MSNGRKETTYVAIDMKGHKIIYEKPKAFLTDPNQNPKEHEKNWWPKSQVRMITYRGLDKPTEDLWESKAIISMEVSDWLLNERKKDGRNYELAAPTEADEPW